MDRSEVPDTERLAPQVLGALIRRAQAANVRFDRLWRYYLGDHDSLRDRSDGVHVAVNYAKYVVDIELGN